MSLIGLNHAICARLITYCEQLADTPANIITLNLPEEIQQSVNEKFAQAEIRHATDMQALGELTLPQHSIHLLLANLSQLHVQAEKDFLHACLQVLHPQGLTIFSLLELPPEPETGSTLSITAQLDDFDLVLELQRLPQLTSKIFRKTIVGENQVTLHCLFVFAMLAQNGMRLKKKFRSQFLEGEAGEIADIQGEVEAVEKEAEEADIEEDEGEAADEAEETEIEEPHEAKEENESAETTEKPELAEREVETETEVPEASEKTEIEQPENDSEAVEIEKAEEAEAVEPAEQETEAETEAHESAEADEGEEEESDEVENETEETEHAHEAAESEEEEVEKENAESDNEKLEVENDSHETHEENATEVHREHIHASSNILSLTKQLQLHKTTLETLQKQLADNKASALQLKQQIQLTNQSATAATLESLANLLVVHQHLIKSYQAAHESHQETLKDFMKKEPDILIEKPELTDEFYDEVKAQSALATDHEDSIKEHQDLVEQDFFAGP